MLPTSKRLTVKVLIGVLAVAGWCLIVPGIFLGIMAVRSSLEGVDASLLPSASLLLAGGASVSLAIIFTYLLARSRNPEDEAGV